jgi:hypothetical protein
VRVVREPHERKLNRLDGVRATVNYATERATVDSMHGSDHSMHSDN